jgi:hypothetical protein
MMRVESMIPMIAGALPKYTTSIPARRSTRVPTRAFPGLPLALSTSTTIA